MNRKWLVVGLSIVILSASAQKRTNSGYDPTLGPASTAVMNAGPTCTGMHTTLLIQDNVPWFAASNQDPLGADVTELKAQQKSYCVITSDLIGATNLHQFRLIVIASDQGQSFYNNLFPSGSAHPALSSWVASGGTVIAHLTDYGWNGGSWISGTFIGGLKHVSVSSNDLGIALPQHAIILGNQYCPGGHCAQLLDVATLQDLDNWNASAHGYFTNLPTGSKVILTDSTTTNPVLIEYSFGNGTVIASLTTTEWWYSGGPADISKENLKLLANEIAYASSVGNNFDLLFYWFFAES